MNDGREVITFIALLRAVAALMVVWCHWVGAGLVIGRPELEWTPGVAVSEWVTIPFAVLHNYGFLGVAIFFLVSGFIISHVMQRDSRASFATKRLFRIYPPLIAAVLLTAMIELFIRPQLGMVSEYEISASQIIESMTLGNFFLGERHAVVGAAWTLAVEMLFYGICFVLLPLLNRRAALGVIAVLVGVAAIQLIGLSLTGRLDDNGVRLSEWASYLPLLVLGQIRYYQWKQRISLRVAAGLSVICLGMFVHATSSTIEHWYAGAFPLVTVAYAYGIFNAALALGPKLRIPPALAVISAISYSLYLMHKSIGRATIQWLSVEQDVPVTVSLTVALVLTIGISWLLWRYVELPFQRVARWILRRGRGRRIEIADESPATPSELPVREVTGAGV